MTIEFKAYVDVGKLNQNLDRLAANLKRPTVANRAASIQLYKEVIKNFDQEGAMFGKWAELKPATIAQKAKIGKEKMLVRSGRLRNAFVPFYNERNAGVRNDEKYKNDRGNKDGRPLNEPGYAGSSNAVEYAAAHQFGVPSRNLPARNMLPSRATVLQIGIKVYDFYVKKWADEANK